MEETRAAKRQRHSAEYCNYAAGRALEVPKAWTVETSLSPLAPAQDAVLLTQLDAEVEVAGSPLPLTRPSSCGPR